MKTITIFTPTYNRAYILPKLYESLCRQSNNDFVWMIVDDGSTDDTEQLVQSWIDDGKIDVEYHKQQNGGKMRAHNLGVRLCDTPLFSCVDSDDYMTDNAIDDIIKFWNNNYHGEEDICGLIAYRAMVIKNDTPKIVKRFPSIRSCTMHDLSKKYNHKGETTIVFRSDVIKKYLFPEIEGEKFVTEAYVYDQIDQKYQTLLFDQALTICEFLPDGYTRSRANIYKIAPKGWAMYFNQQFDLWKGEYTFREKLKTIVYYIVFSQIGNADKIYRNSKDKSYRFWLAYILAPYYKTKIKKLFS